MKKIQKTCSVFLAVFMILSILPIQLFAATVKNPWEGATVNSNVFLDALKYTGYDVSQFTVNGKSGANVTKRSKIGYNASGATGFETSNGKPNISAFESNGLCCASYATYVYFNYLPNVYGLDTSFLAKPSNGRSTSAWYTACEKWVQSGVAKKTVINKSCSSANNLTALQNIAIGSLLIFTDNNGGYSHTGIYAGTKNGNYYQTQVGNSRGPEVQLINGFFSGPSSYANLLAAYTPIPPEATGRVGIQKVDDAGNAVSGAKIGVYSDGTCTKLLTTLTTNSDGKAVYAEYLEAGTTIYFKETSAPTGYDISTQVVSATVVADKTTYASTKIVDNRQGKISVTKYDDSGAKLGVGYVFGVYSDKACAKQVTTITTNSSGVATSGYLSAGTYYVKETALPSSDKTHKLNTTVYTVTVTRGGTTAVNSGKIVNDRMRGNAQVTKTSEDGVLEGFVFRLFGTSDSGTAVNITATTDATGTAKFDNVLIGTYTVEEVNTPERYVVPTSKTVKVTNNGNATVTFNNALKRSDLTVKKTSEDGIIADVKFSLTGTALNGSAISMTATTDKNGIAKFTDILPSDSNGYVLTEVGAAEYYVPVGTKVIHLMNGIDGEVTVNNVLKKGTVEVTKSAEDGLIEGILFRLTGISMSGAKVDITAATDANGVATFNDVLISGDAPYTIEEVDTAIKYVIPENQSGAVTWNEVTKVSFNNVLKKFSVTITKVDAETTVAQGDASLAGAVYGIYNDGKLIDTYTTDSNGQFTTCEYICGENWTVKEITPSEGYLLDNTVYTVGASAKLYTLESNATSNTVTEQVIKGKINLTKLAVKDKNEVGTPEKGAIFSIRLKSTGALVDTLTIGADGTATSIKLPYGTYIVHQEKGWEGYKNVSDFEVFIDKDDNIYSYILNDYIYAAYIKVTKVDGETGKTVAYSGAGFQMYDADGNLVKIKVTYPTHTEIDTFYTDTNGILITPAEIPYGDYTLVEVKAPHGYVLDSTPIPFSVNPSTMVEEDGILVVKVYKKNYAQKGTISVFKEGEVFWNVGQTEGKYAPEYKAMGLAGAVYEIYAAEDIVTLDGTVRYAKGTLVDTITTDSTGCAKSKALYLGKYEVVEVKAPTGYVINTTPKQIEIVYGNQTETLVSTGVAFTNDRQKVEIGLMKVMEENADFGIGNNGEVENVKFGLYANENITAANGTVLPKDGLIEEVTVSANGNVKFSSDLPFGQYYVKEIATDDHYILNGTKYLVTFSYAGQNTNTVSLTVNGGTVKNNLKYGSVEGSKVDEYGKPVADAVIGLFLTEDASEPVYTTVSDSNGKFRFDKIPFGTWYVKEISQPEGFLLNNDVFPVTIKNNGDVVKVTIVNEYIKGSLVLTKADRDYHNELLSNATFTIYRDSDNNGVYNIGDEKVGTLTETENGVYKSEFLIYGRYFVKETKAPLGFVIDATPYEVFIDTHGKIYTISNDKSGLFVNTPREGNLKIIKEAEDNRVIGREFRVYGTDITGHYFDKNFKTDSNGEIYISDLREGYYTIEEINTPDGYIQPKKQEVYVGHGNIEMVYVYNALERGNVEIHKDAEDGIIENVEFKLYGTSTVGDYFETYAKTNKNGVATFKNIPVGNYTVEEVNVPVRYLAVASQNVTVEYNKTASLYFQNVLKKGNVTLTKIDADYPENKLTEAIFGIYEDVNENGILDSNDRLYAHLTETSEGVYELKDIPYGHYLVKELKAPVGFIVDKNVYEVFIEVDGMTYTITNDTSGCFINNPALGALDILKESEDGIKEGFEFRVTGTAITGQTYDEIFATDENGKIHIENLRIGTYTVTELNVADRYIAPADVTVSVETDKVAVVNIYNALKRGNVTVNKTAEDDILEGHKFHLYGTSLAGIAVDEYAVTDENGIAVFENILISDLNGYVIEEVETANRYLVPAKQTVNVEYELTSEVNFYNQLKRGNITLTKVDNEFRDKLLSGAEFEVYFDVNDNGIYEEGIDILVGTMAETEKGIYRIDGVRYGGYFVHEKTAPNHYVADIGYYYVAVLADGETVVAENTKDTGLFINGIKRGNILIIKNSEDGVKEGFSFRVTGNGINMIVVTDSNGQALIENLRVDSDYVIEEIEDEASAKYIRPDAVTVTLIDGMTLEVDFYNAIQPVVDIPNTDYAAESYAIFNTAVLFASLTVAAMFVYLICKKKRSKKSEN